MSVDLLERPTLDTGFVDLMLGVHFGDEGKGKFVDWFLRSGLYSMCARFNGGANAGHQLVFNEHEIALHQIPSGIANDADNFLNFITTGSYVDPVELLLEMEDVRGIGISVSPDNLIISDTAQYVLPHHKTRDRLREAGKGGQGTTAKGISFVASEKYERIGARPELIDWDPDRLHELVTEGLIRVNRMIRESGLPEDVLEKNKLREVDPEQGYEEFHEAALIMHAFVKDPFRIINDRLKAGENMLAETAQSTGLDIDQGISPLGTSSHATPGGALNGMGFAPQRFRNIIAVAKIPMTRVGGGEDGPFPTELDPRKDRKAIKRLQGKREDPDGEYGRTSGRKRKIGRPDNTLVNRAVELGANKLILTKLDKVPGFGRYIDIAYEHELNGEVTPYAPNSALKFAACKPHYRRLPTWRKDISGMSHYSELPPNAKNLVEFFEEDSGIPVVAVGVGPDRDQVIIRDKDLFKT